MINKKLLGYNSSQRAFWEDSYLAALRNPSLVTIPPEELADRSLAIWVKRFPFELEKKVKLDETSKAPSKT